MTSHRHLLASALLSPGVWVRAVALVLVLALTPPPIGAGLDNLVGIARCNGSAAINGLQFSDGTNVYSGDRLSTVAASNILLSIYPEDRIALSPESAARVTRNQSGTVILLEQGRATFRGLGRSSTALVSHYASIRPIGAGENLVEAAMVDPQHTRVSAIRGSVEIASDDKTITLQAGQAAMVAEVEDQSPQDTGSGGNTKPAGRRKAAIWVLAVAGVAATTFISVELANKPKPVSPPPKKGQ